MKQKDSNGQVIKSLQVLGFTLGPEKMYKHRNFQWVLSCSRLGGDPSPPVVNFRSIDKTVVGGTKLGRCELVSRITTAMEDTREQEKGRWLFKCLQKIITETSI